MIYEEQIANMGVLFDPAPIFANVGEIKIKGWYT
jgi:hypothetical protein